MSLQVKSLMERVLLSLMSQVMYGLLERAQDEDMYFSPHAQEEFGKIFWKDSEAAGFYTVKRKGDPSVAAMPKSIMCLHNTL